MELYAANALGESIVSPSPEQMWKMLRELDPEDEEHGAAWLATDSGFALEWHVEGRLALVEPSRKGCRHLRISSRERVLELWMMLATGALDALAALDWQPGNGRVVTPERLAELREWERQQDRAFYDVLGDERADVRCQEPGCARGAISQSVLCRPHHFEMVKKRPCPFGD
jgi:hypothetical protein